MAPSTWPYQLVLGGSEDERASRCRSRVEPQAVLGLKLRPRAEGAEDVLVEHGRLTRLPAHPVREHGGKAVIATSSTTDAISPGR